MPGDTPANAPASPACSFEERASTRTKRRQRRRRYARLRLPPLHVVCGLDPLTDCPTCRGAREKATRAKIDRLTPPWLSLWNRLRQGFALLQRAWRAEQPPDPMPPKEFAGLVRALCEPQYRKPFAAALAPEIFAIARQVARAELAAERRAR